MKKRLLYISAFILALLVSSCDFLDKEPDDMKTDSIIWSSRKETEKYLYNVYSFIPKASWHNADPWLGCSDEIDLTWNVYPTYNINLGNWNPSTNFYVKWGSYYQGIRASFIFENNVDKCPDLSDDLKTQYKAEVKFLRGYYYWLILRQYGPAVLLKNEIDFKSDWSTVTRAPYDECIDYVCQMMDEAEPDLPLKQDDSWLGKPTQVACRAVKAEALLFAASPQWNGNTEYANFKNNDGTPLASTSYDESKWEKAAEACLATIQLAEIANIRLYRNDRDGGDATFNPYKSVRDITLAAGKNNNYTEVIFGRYDFDVNSWEVHASPGSYNLGGVAPTQRIVDAFFMNNGRTIEDSQSGYTEEGFASTGGDNWNPNNLDVTGDRIALINKTRDGEAWGHWPGDWNMYANREPRFYASILYNKRMIPQIAADVDKRNYFSSSSQKNGYGRVEFYNGGISGHTGSSTFFPRTGYLVLKHVNPMDDMRTRTYETRTNCEIFIRYAQILLDYIEALNEYSPNHPDIQKYWNMIHERAGIPGIFDVYPGIKGDKNQQREYILRERQVELCFETDRYFTTRRRWLSSTPDTGGNDDSHRKYGDGGRMWGMNINGGSASTNNFSYTGFYKRTAFESRVFEKKMYLFPIPQAETEKAPNVVQNPWW